MCGSRTCRRLCGSRRSLYGGDFPVESTIAASTKLNLNSSLSAISTAVPVYIGQIKGDPFEMAKPTIVSERLSRAPATSNVSRLPSCLRSCLASRPPSRESMKSAGLLNHQLFKLIVLLFYYLHYAAAIKVDGKYRSFRVAWPIRQT